MCQLNSTYGTKKRAENSNKRENTSLSLLFFPECKKKKCSSTVCDLDRGINRWNAHGKSESQYCNHPPYVKWAVMLCHTAQESCHIYQQRVESKSAVIGRPLHNGSLKRPLLTHFLFPPSYGSGKRGRKKSPCCPPLVCLRAENSSRGLKDCRTISSTFTMRVLRVEEQRAESGGAGGVRGMGARDAGMWDVRGSNGKMRARTSACKWWNRMLH